MSWTPANTGPGGFTTSSQPFRPLSLNRSRHNAATQVREPGSLFNFYRQLIALRQQFPALATGTYEADRVEGLAWTFQRAQGGERIAVAINYGDTPARVSVALPAGARALPLLAKASALHSNAQGQAQLRLAPLSLKVYRVVTP